MKKMLAVALIVVAGISMFSASTVLAQDFCNGDFTYDGDVDSFDLTEFLNHFGRGKYDRPCPPDGPAGVPKTGWTICYDAMAVLRDCTGTGEDGEHQRGVACPSPRFTDNLDGTVMDNCTRLIWLKNANCMVTNYVVFDNDGIVGDGLVKWQTALDFVRGINDGTYPLCGAGYNDWRTPNRTEAKSMYQVATGSIFPHPFVNMGSEAWTRQLR